MKICKNTSHENLLNYNQPVVAVGVMILKEVEKTKYVLFGKRNSSHGTGEYSFPGGHLEYMESITDCALREIKEECGLKVKDLKFACTANIKDYAPKHYVFFGYVAKWESGEPINLEPEKCEGWDWHNIENLPKPLFATCKILLKTYKTGQVYFE